eukprot:INCI15613.2.p1 GENE.INCI15613.2~~INCI15613.2.p1  ORF type:complete len:595 (-),score=96.82 INCI15613.2:52-1836(-)
METVRSGAARVGKCACAVNEAVQTRISRIFFPFNDKEIPPKLRKQAWAFRVTYVCWTAGQTMLVFYCPRTYLWQEDGETLNAHAAWTVLLMLLVSWFFYFQVQGSNPGYITATMLHRFNTKHDVFGVGDNGEGDSFSMAVFRKLTNLGRRARTTKTEARGKQRASTYAEEDSDSSSSSGEEDDPVAAPNDVAIDIAEGNQSAAISDRVDDNAPAFIPADSYEGPRKGYVYATGGDGGTSGYYREAPAERKGKNDEQSEGKDGEGEQRGEEDGAAVARDASSSEALSKKALQAESMARVERFLAGQDRGKARKYWVPKSDMSKYTENDKSKSRKHSKQKKRRHRGSKHTYDSASVAIPDADRRTSEGHGTESSSDDEDDNKYAQSKFVVENGEISREAVEDGSFQTRMDFEDIRDDFPLRSHYCKQADRVVPKFDHYCTTLGTPIGERNHALFWMFLVAQSVLLVWAISIVSTGFTGNFIFGPERWAGRNALLIVNIVLLSGEAVGVVALLAFQTWCACTDSLTREFLKNNDLDYLAKFGPCDLPFSKGQCRNFYRFFVVQPGWCTSSAEWLPTKYVWCAGAISALFSPHSTPWI